MAAFDVSVGRAQSAQFEFFSRESRSNARGVEKKNYSNDFPQTSKGGVGVPREPIARKKRGGHRERRRAIVRWRRPRIEFVFIFRRESRSSARLEWKIEFEFSR